MSWLVSVLAISSLATVDHQLTLCVANHYIITWCDPAFSMCLCIPYFSFFLCCTVNKSYIFYCKISFKWVLHNLLLNGQSIIFNFCYCRYLWHSQDYCQHSLLNYYYIHYQLLRSCVDWALTFIFTVSLFSISVFHLCFSKPRAPSRLGGPTQTTSPSDRPVWTPSVTGWVSCPWCTPRWGWTLCCSGTRFPSWGRNTGTLKNCECTRIHTKSLCVIQRPWQESTHWMWTFVRL